MHAQIVADLVNSVYSRLVIMFNCFKVYYLILTSSSSCLRFMTLFYDAFKIASCNPHKGVNYYIDMINGLTALHYTIFNKYKKNRNESRNGVTI